MYLKISIKILLTFLFTVSFMICITGYAIISHKIIHQNGLKEFVISKEIKHNNCSCACNCAPKGTYESSLPALLDANILTKSSPKQHFKIVKEIRKNKCSCFCFCVLTATKPVADVSTTSSTTAATQYKTTSNENEVRKNESNIVNDLAFIKKLMEERLSEYSTIRPTVRQYAEESTTKQVDTTITTLNNKYSIMTETTTDTNKVGRNENTTSILSDNKFTTKSTKLVTITTNNDISENTSSNKFANVAIRSKSASSDYTESSTEKVTSTFDTSTIFFRSNSLPESSEHANDLFSEKLTSYSPTTISTIVPTTQMLSPIFKAKVANLLNRLKEELIKLRQSSFSTTSPKYSTILEIEKNENVFDNTTKIDATTAAQANFPSMEGKIAPTKRGPNELLKTKKLLENLKYQVEMLKIAKNNEEMHESISALEEIENEHFPVEMNVNLTKFSSISGISTTKTPSSSTSKKETNTENPVNWTEVPLRQNHAASTQKNIPKTTSSTPTPDATETSKNSAYTPLYELKAEISMAKQLLDKLKQRLNQLKKNETTHNEFRSTNSLILTTLPSLYSTATKLFTTPTSELPSSERSITLAISELTTILNDTKNKFENGEAMQSTTSVYLEPSTSATSTTSIVNQESTTQQAGFTKTTKLSASEALTPLASTLRKTSIDQNPGVLKNILASTQESTTKSSTTVSLEFSSLPTTTNSASKLTTVTSNIVKIKPKILLVNMSKDLDEEHKFAFVTEDVEEFTTKAISMATVLASTTLPTNTGVNKETEGITTASFLSSESIITKPSEMIKIRLTPIHSAQNDELKQSTIKSEVKLFESTGETWTSSAESTTTKWITEKENTEEKPTFETQLNSNDDNNIQEKTKILLPPFHVELISETTMKSVTSENSTDSLPITVMEKKLRNLQDTLANRLEQARQLREEQKQLEILHSIRRELTANGETMLHLEQRKKAIEARLARLAQTERWHRELIQRYQLQQLMLTNANVQNWDANRHRNDLSAASNFTPSMTASDDLNDKRTRDSASYISCGPIRKFIITFKVQDPVAWLHENCPVVKQLYPTASCEQIQYLLSGCFQN